MGILQYYTPTSGGLYHALGSFITTYDPALDQAVKALDAHLDGGSALEATERGPEFHAERRIRERAVRLAYRDYVARVQHGEHADEIWKIIAQVAGSAFETSRARTDRENT